MHVEVSEWVELAGAVAVVVTALGKALAMVIRACRH